ncbi:UNVERIFIED_CONTAM: hypothetical protein K2H54_039699 [Gekko kuhli]
MPLHLAQPQPYRALKESDSADGDENTSPAKPHGPGHADPPTPDSPTEISLLESIFIGLEVEPQPLTQAKSLEDLRITKEDETQQCTFDYQRMDPGFSEKSWAAPGMKLTHPYKQFWGLGHDDMAIPTKCSQNSPERPLTTLGKAPPVPRRPQSRDNILDPTEKEVGSSPVAQGGNITIPRPQGRKTPELGIVPPPPAPRPAKQQAKVVESVLYPSKPQETKDPFEDLLNKTKQEVSVTPGDDLLPLQCDRY